MICEVIVEKNTFIPHYVNCLFLVLLIELVILEVYSVNRLSMRYIMDITWVVI